MQFGVNPGYVYLGSSVAEELAFAVEAEELGYDSFWVGEPYGNDAATVLASFATATSTIALGSSIMAIPGRTPAMAAQTAATLDLISEGRFVLGLGSSGPQVAEGWHGVPFARQLQRTREYVDVVRMALRHDRLVYDGETIQLPLPGGDGKALKLIIKPLRSEVPIYLAALGPRNVELCGEIADGWLPMWYSPEHAPELRTPLLMGAERANRDPDSIAVAALVATYIDEDLDAARAAARPMLALYVGGMGPRGRNFYNTLVSSYGFGEVAERVQDLYLDGHQAEAAAVLPDELIDLVCLCGSEERVAQRMEAYARSGVDTLISFPLAADGTGKLEQLRRFARAKQHRATEARA